MSRFTDTLISINSTSKIPAEATGGVKGYATPNSIASAIDAGTITIEQIATLQSTLTTLEPAWNKLVLGEANHIPFNLTPIGVPADIGVLHWDEGEEALSYHVEAGSIQIGKEMYDYYTNLSGGTLVDGQIVSVIGATGNRSAVVLTDATQVELSRATIGMVTHGGDNNQKVRVTKVGTVHKLNTDAFTEGAKLYVDPLVPGGLTETRPSLPAYIISVGVVQVKQAVNGVIDVHIDVQSVSSAEVQDACANSPASIRAALDVYSTAQVDAMESVSLVSQLPPAGVIGAGGRRFVNDSLNPPIGNFGTRVYGLGSNSTPVYSDGTHWFIG